MQETTSKEKILKKVRKALISKSNNTFPNLDFESNVFRQSPESPEVAFATRFKELGGKFFYCEDLAVFVEHFSDLFSDDKGWPEIACKEELIKEILSHGQVPYNDSDEAILNPDISVTSCEFLVGRTGTIVISTALTRSRKIFINPRVHVVLAYASQVVPDLRDALKEMKMKYPAGLPPFVSWVTGRSCTADIESTIVTGVYGPKDIFVFLVDDISA